MNHGVDAMSRTTRLLNRELFGAKADETLLADGLLKCTVRVEGDHRNAGTVAGQHALMTVVMLLVRMGISVDLRVPEIELSVRHPLLRGDTFTAAIKALVGDLMPGATIRAVDRPDFALVLGNSRSGAQTGLRMQFTDTSFSLVALDRSVPAIKARMPIGAYGVAAAGVAESVRAVIPRLSAAAEIAVEARHLRLDPAPVARVDLAELFPALRRLPERLALGRLDFVSAGAITNAALYVLSGFGTQMVWTGRVMDDDTLEGPNLNRNAMVLRSQLGMPKVEALASAFSELEPLQVRFTGDDPNLVLADRVLVGVDHIESRWEVQRQWPGWLGCGATQSLDVIVSEHRPGEPCVGCVHSEAMPVPDVVPTISFVSFWSGLLQVLYLISDVAGVPVSAPALSVSPFGWSGPYLMEIPLGRQDRCPVGCQTATAPAAAPGSPS